MRQSLYHDESFALDLLVGGQEGADTRQELGHLFENHAIRKEVNRDHSFLSLEFAPLAPPSPIYPLIATQIKIIKGKKGGVNQQPSWLY